MWLIVRDDSKPLNRNRNLGTHLALYIYVRPKNKIKNIRMESKMENIENKWNKWKEELKHV